MLNFKLLKYGAVNLDSILAIHLDGDFDSVLSLLQGQVTSDCTQIRTKYGQPSSLCDEKGFILCNFDIIFDQNRWLIIIDKNTKDIFLNEMEKFLPFYKVTHQILNSSIMGVFRKKEEVAHQREHLIIEAEEFVLSLLIKSNKKAKLDFKKINKDEWNINRKIIGDHLISAEEVRKYRPHELGQQNYRVSLKKGCFRGQEIIARMEYLSKLKKDTKLIIYNDKKEVSKFTIIGETYLYEGNYFSSCLAKKFD